MTKFEHIQKGTWTGGYGCPPNPRPQICDIAGIHLTRNGSNSAYTGFTDLIEASCFRRTLPDRAEWKIVDLRLPIAA